MNSCTVFCFLFLDDDPDRIFGWAGEDCPAGQAWADALELELTAFWLFASVDSSRRADLEIGGANARPIELCKQLRDRDTFLTDSPCRIAAFLSIMAT